MKYLLTFLLLLSTLFLVIPASVQAEAVASDSALTKYNISFPISELGNCNSLNECKTYCSSTDHQTECLAFAKKKGFYKVPPKQVDLMTKAKAELGCSSADECRQFCAQEANWERCGEFAKKYRLSSTLPQVNTRVEEILKRAKELLGCSSLDSCKLVCAKRENFDKCQNLTILPLQPPVSTTTKCLEMKKVLEANGTLPPSAAELFKRYCGELNGMGKVSSSSGTIGIALEYCRNNPEKCQELLKNSGSILECSKKPGCYYNPGDGACKCVATGSALPAEVKNYSEVVKQYAEVCSQKGCSWTGTACNCPNPTPKSEVQGVSMEAGLIQILRNFLSGK